MNIKKVGVVGCGSMGGGIAQLCAQSGYQVVVSEINEDLLNKGIGALDKTLARLVERTKITQDDKTATMGRIKGTVNSKDFADCDLMIEAAIENIEIKKKIFADLDKVCQKDAILGTNTSCLSVIDIAKATNRIDKVLGLHFFNPAPVMKLLEIVKTVATSDETIATAREFGKTLGKTPVLAQDTPGFIVNRLWIPYILDGIRMLESGLASRDDIDTGITQGLNHPMGPLTLGDFTGNDVVLFVADALYDALRDPKFVAPVLLKKMVAAGWLGRKTGKGFYDYTGK